MSSKKRSPSKADRDAKIVEIKTLRDSIADKEKAGEACKGLYKCYKSADNTACLAKMKMALEKLKAGEAKKGGKARSKSPSSRSRSKSPARSRSRSRPRK